MKFYLNSPSFNRLIQLICVVVFLSPQFLQAQKLWETTKYDLRTLSSPNSADLNSDGVEDIVIGSMFQQDGLPQYGSITAFDGDDGSVIWNTVTRSEIFTMPRFMDITNDGVPDVFAGGRYAQYTAFDGTDGSVIWEVWPASAGNWWASGFGNFYTGQFIDDINGDGVMDILNVNGGGGATEDDVDRVRGSLVVISGLDGLLLKRALVPGDIKKESFISPILADLNGDGVDESVLFGTGGESLPGKFYRVDFADVMNEDISNAEVLVENDQKGYICTPALADLTGDNIHDIIIPSIHEKISLINGATLETEWEVTIPGTESYVTPVLGNFAGDDEVLDVMGIFQHGAWLNYDSCTMVVINGATGEIAWEHTGFDYQLGSPMVVDFDEGGLDEMILSLNYRSSETGDTLLMSRLALVDLDDEGQFGDFTALDDEVVGYSLSTSALLKDLDNDDKVDLVFAYTKSVGFQIDFKEQDFVLTRIELAFNPEIIPWGSFLGTNEDARYPLELPLPTDQPVSLDNDAVIYPNPTTGEINIEVSIMLNKEDVFLTDILGRRMEIDLTNPYRINIADYSRGVYLLNVKVDERWVTKKIILE